MHRPEVYTDTAPYYYAAPTDMLGGAVGLPDQDKDQEQESTNLEQEIIPVTLIAEDHVWLEQLGLTVDSRL